MEVVLPKEIIMSSLKVIIESQILRPESLKAWYKKLELIHKGVKSIT